jgi:hypothetical protein
VSWVFSSLVLCIRYRYTATQNWIWNRVYKWRVYSTNGRWIKSMEKWWDKTERGHRSTQRRICPIVTLSPTNPTLTGLRSNLTQSMWNCGGQSGSETGISAELEGIPTTQKWIIYKKIYIIQISVWKFGT